MGQVAPVQEANSESKEETMVGASRVAQPMVIVNDDSDSSFAGGGGTSSSDNITDTQKRRRLKEWVIPNPVDTALHPTMDLPG
jgi:hypothetical protein